jgi:hypothetical protein
MTDVAQALLEAHVQHELERLTGDHLDARIRDAVAATFQWLEDVPMNDVLAREQVFGVIERHVIDLRISGGITELAGEMSNVVFSSDSAKTTRVDELFSGQAYREFADKIGALDGVQRELIGYVTRSAAFRALVSRLILRTVAKVFFRDSDPSWKTRISAAVEHRFPGIEAQLGAVVSRYGEVLSERLASDANRRLREILDVEWLRLMADEVWDDVSKRPIADAGRLITAQDLEDFVVLGYEVWSRFRKTDYFRTVSFEVVDRIFEKYGGESIRSVILDMGVTEQMIAHELTTFLRPFFAEARRSSFLEAQIRSRLEPFYRSSVVADVLGQRER